MLNLFFKTSVGCWLMPFLVGASSGDGSHHGGATRPGIHSRRAYHARLGRTCLFHFKQLDFLAILFCIFFDCIRHGCLILGSLLFVFFVFKMVLMWPCGKSCFLAWRHPCFCLEKRPLNFTVEITEASCWRNLPRPIAFSRTWKTVRLGAAWSWVGHQEVKNCPVVTGTGKRCWPREKCMANDHDFTEIEYGRCRTSSASKTLRVFRNTCQKLAVWLSHFIGLAVDEWNTNSPHFTARIFGMGNSSVHSRWWYISLYINNYQYISGNWSSMDAKLCGSVLQPWVHSFTN